MEKGAGASSPPIIMARQKKETTPGTVKARVLVDCPFGKCDQVVELSGGDLKTATESGWVDADPAAVAYAETLGGAE